MVKYLFFSRVLQERNCLGHSPWVAEAAESLDSISRVPL